MILLRLNAQKFYSNLSKQQTLPYLLFSFLQELQMAHMKEIESPCHIHDLISGLGRFTVRKLNDLLSGGQELRTACVWGPSRGILTHR